MKMIKRPKSLLARNKKSSPSVLSAENNMELLDPTLPLPKENETPLSAQNAEIDPKKTPEAMRKRAESLKKTPFHKLRENPGSHKLANHAKCWECSGGHPEIRDSETYGSIKHCHMDDCPLWIHRPWKAKVTS